MVYENNSMSSTKQEIFRQIDQDILSQKKSNMTISQKTKSNYRFVVILDCVALLLAMVGVIFVYDIFKEQQIKLVSGQQGIKALESTLLEEINRQYALNLAEMEQRLRESNERVAALELAHAEELARIAAEAVLELERQRVIIQREMIAEMQGKSISEQEEIQRKYALRLREIEATIERDNAIREEAEQERYRRTLLQITQDANREERELEALRSRVNEMQAQIDNKSYEVIDNSQFHNIDDSIKNFEDSAASLFLQTKQHMDDKDYHSATERLSDISTLYRSVPSTFPRKRRDSDNYFVSVLRDFINASEKHEQQQITISNLESELLNRGDVQTSRGSIEIMNQMLKRGDDFVEDRQYAQAVDSYQTALRYVGDGNAEEVVQKLYNAMLLEIKSTDSNIPKNLESSVKKLLKDTRYNDMEYPVLYLREPNGYIADIIDRDNVLVLLLPRERVTRNQELEIYRVTSQNGIQLEKIGEFRSKNAERDTFKVQMNNHRVRLGDLVYIK